MYIAMNRFKVLKDCTKDFENAWFTRESYLHELPGFVAFHLLKGPEREDHVSIPRTPCGARMRISSIGRSRMLSAKRTRVQATASRQRLATPNSKVSMCCRRLARMAWRNA